MIILNAEPSGYSAEARDILQLIGDVREVECTTREMLIDQIEDVDVLIVRLAHMIDVGILEKAKSLKVIVSATTGLNHIDLQAATDRRIKILSLKGERDFLKQITATAEHTWGLLLALVRKLPGAVSHVRDNGWDRDQFQGRQLSGLTLGIVGFGRLGTILADYGRAFRMSVIAYDEKPVEHPEFVEMTELDQLLAKADVICLLPSLQTSSQKMIGKAEFDHMKPDSVLINTSRGEVLDSNALLDALEQGKLAGAALDVLDSEAEHADNWQQNHPLIAFAKNSDRLLITPHIGGATYDSMRQTEVFMAEKLSNLIKEEINERAS